MMIEKIIHFVWVNNSHTKKCPMPDYTEANIAEWRRLNPEYEVILWNNSDISALDNADAFELARNNGEASDVIRYELIKNLGGYSIDIDIWPTRPMSVLLDDFKAFKNANGFDADAIVLDDGSRVFGCKKWSEFFIDVNWRVAAIIDIAKTEYPNLKCAFTGFHLLTQCRLDAAGKEKVLVLPGSTYFPTRGSETEMAIGIHEFDATWIKQIA